MTSGDSRRRYSLVPIRFNGSLNTTKVGVQSKTSQALETIAFNMKQDQNFLACWVESEKSLEREFVCQTFGIDPERFVFIEYDENKGAEGILDILYAFMKAVKFDMVVINSLKCLTPKKIIDADMDMQTPAIAARLNSLMVAKFTALVANSGAAFVLITHQYTSIGSYGSPMVISGGMAIRYWAAIILAFTRPKVTDSDPIKPDEGVHIKVSVKKNHCVPDRNPYMNFEYYAIFGEGTDNTIPLIMQCVEAGIVENKGAMYNLTLLDGTEISKRGKAAFRRYLKDNPDITDELIKRLGGEVSTVQTMSEAEIDTAKSEEAEVADIAGTLETGAKKQKGKK